MAPRTTHTVRVGSERFSVEIAGDGTLRIAGIEGTWHVVAGLDGGCLVSNGEDRQRVFVAGTNDRLQAFAEGDVFDVQVEREGRPARTVHRPQVEALTVPMPARVVKVLVVQGQAVRRGDVLVTLEAMKMELPLKAPSDGTVRTVACREGDLVQPGAALVELG